MKEKVSRNQKLIKDYLKLKKEGGSMVWLVSKYQISTQRIFYLLRREGIIVDNRSKKVYK